MRIISIAILIVFCMVLNQSIFAGEGQSSNTTYRLIFKDGKSIQVRSAYTKDGLIITESHEGFIRQYPVRDVFKVQQQDGTHWKKGLSNGAVGGLVISFGILAIAVIHTTNNTSKTINTKAIAPLFSINIATGALIGCGIGSAFKKWIPATLDSKISFEFNSDRNLFCLTYNF